MMIDDNTEGAPAEPGPRRKRTVAVAAVVGVAGLVGGGLAAGALSSASAESSGSGVRPGYAAPQGYGARPPAGRGADGSQPRRGDEKLLTGTTRTKVLAVVTAKYPKATIERVETDFGGVYEAHIVNAGTSLIVKVDKDFKITGTEDGPGAGGRG